MAPLEQALIFVVAALVPAPCAGFHSSGMPSLGRQVAIARAPPDSTLREEKHSMVEALLLETDGVVFEAHHDVPPGGTPLSLHWLPDSYKATLRDISAKTSTKMAALLQWHGDIFQDPTRISQEWKVRERKGIFHVDRKISEWCVFVGCVVAMFTLDRCVLQGRTRDAGLVTHVAHVLLWIGCAVGYAAFIWASQGEELFFQWGAGYLFEWILSIDNLFLFHLVFRNFRTPEALIHKALFLGIIGAVLFRMAFFVLFHSLLHLHWLFRYLFGTLLIASGIQAATEGNEDREDVTTSPIVDTLRRFIGPRFHDAYDLDGGIFVRKNGLLCATLLVPVILCLEITDAVFAVDSVSVKVAQIPDQFMNFSSSVFAMFGARAMYFVIHHAMKYLELMKYGLCFILVFIGLQMVCSDFVKLSASSICLLLLSVFLICAVIPVLRHSPKSLSHAEEMKTDKEHLASGATTPSTRGSISDAEN